MGNPYEDTITRSTTDKIKGEFKSGIFWYAVSKIISKVFALVVGGAIMLLALITRYVFNFILTDEEREIKRKSNEEKALAVRRDTSLETRAQKIAMLKQISEETRR